MTHLPPHGRSPRQRPSINSVVRRKRRLSVGRLLLIGSIVFMVLVLAIALAYGAAKGIGEFVPVGIASTVVLVFVLPLVMCGPIGVAVYFYERHLRRARVRRVVTCEVCGYSLVDLPSTGVADERTVTCPECGQAYAVVDV